MIPNLHRAVLAALGLSAGLVAGAALASPDRGGPRALMQEMRFAEIDADGDGAVTLPEWTAHVTARAEAARAAWVGARVEALMAGDADGDGRLSAEELAARMLALQDERRAARAEARAAGDTRRERGELRRHALREGHRGPGRHGGLGLGPGGMEPGEWVVRSFQRIDRDGDGRITEAEFDRAMARMAERVERMQDRRARRAE